MTTTTTSQENINNNNNNGKLFSSIFSSAVKTSLSQAPVVVPKKTTSSTPKKALVHKDQKPAAAAVVKQQQQQQQQDSAWVTVGSKKNKYNAAAAAAANNSPAKVTAASNNKVAQKCQPTPVAAATTTKKLTLANNNMYTTLTLPTGPWQNTKAYQKNVRRHARRRAQRQAAAAQKALVEEQQPRLLQEDAKAVSLAPATPTSTTTSSTTEGSRLLALPYAVLTEHVLSYLRPEDMAKLGACCKYAKTVAEEGFLWQTLFRLRFPSSQLSPTNMQQWKLAYQMSLTSIVDRLRCFATQMTFLEDILGVGVSFTVNPKTKNVDYIDLKQDLLSETAFRQHNVRADVFGNSFDIFLPLYFSEEHFQRALPLIRKAMFRLASPSARGYARVFEPLMVLDVLPKICNTFTVLLADEGISASRKSFQGLLRVHRLFLALAHEYPVIKRAALMRLKKFVSSESHRHKEACPSLGSILPLLMVVDQADFGWPQLGPTYMGESFDRSVLWTCKKYPSLERTHDAATGKVEALELGEKRVKLTLDAMTVSLRLTMFHVYFYRATCLGTTTQERANRYDRFFGQPEPEEGLVETSNTEAEGGEGEAVTSAPEAAVVVDAPTSPAKPQDTLSFSHFRDCINYILTVNTWQKFFSFVGFKCPPSKADMADRLRLHVRNSLRKKYHTKGMDFSRVQASGTSKILSKGQQYSASSELRRVVFRNVWNFSGHTKYLDATCLLYKGQTLCETVDFDNTQARGVIHSGDMMRDGGGTHTIHIGLDELDPAVTSCVFVISAFARATLADILSPSISFWDADAAAPLCTYDLDAHDKVSYLTSVIMCRLYRTRDGGWHVQAIGDAHKGAADNYGPIYAAVKKLL